MIDGHVVARDRDHAKAKLRKRGFGAHTLRKLPWRRALFIRFHADTK